MTIAFHPSLATIVIKNRNKYYKTEVLLCTAAELNLSSIIARANHTPGTPHLGNIAGALKNQAIELCKNPESTAYLFF